MNSRLFPLSNNQLVQGESINRPRAFWASIIFTFVALASLVFVIFLANILPVWQVYVITTITAIAAVVDIIGTVLIWRGQTATGLKYLYWSLLFTIAPNVLLVTNTTPFMIAIVLLVGYVHVFFLQPRTWRKSYQLGPLVAAVFMGIVELLQPGFRLNVNNTSPSSGYFGPLVLLFLIISLAFLMLRQIWGNTSLSLKMGLLTALLIIGMVAIAISAYVGVQNLEYQLSNIYDFMLVPIVAINHADTALADAELYVVQSQKGDFNTAEQAKRRDGAIANNQSAKEVIDRYNSEWVTTVSPEFTQALRDGGMLSLQKQEIAALNNLNSSFAAYQMSFDKYLARGQSGTLDANPANEVIANLRAARANLQKLIDINSKYAEFSDTTARAATQRVTVNNSIVLAIGVIISILASYFIIISITGRLNDLTRSATAMQSGDLDQSVTVTGRDEISLLGTVFNDMASRLRNLFRTLEQRVAARTHNLELAAEVGRAISQVHDLNVMLKDACELILKEFDLYYVQVYLTDPSRTTLKLEAGTGTVGAQLVARGHSLPLDSNSINGRAAVDKHTVVIADTAQSASFRKNALLPDTRGEMAVPLIVADKVVGVLDMQSSKPDVLIEEVLSAFEALAGQLAVAIQNANLLAETEQARAEVEKQARRLVRTSWSEHLDAIHKPERIGFVFDHNQVSPLTEEDISQAADNEKTISASISVTGESLGSLVMEIDDESRREQASELVSVVARQVAQQIENLRLLESAERYRYEAEQAARLQTRENWQAYFQSERDNTISYLYDLNEVRPSNPRYETNENTYTLPLKVRDEAIGKLAIQGLASDDHESIDLINAVADRLTAHIEGLRQNNQTESALAQSEKLFDASRSLTLATDLQQLVNTAVSTLNIPEINRAILVSFNYNESDNVESLDVIANWWNGTGQQATTIGTHYPVEVIRVMQMFISPTPVFFDDTFTDERVDATTMQLVQRLILRAVAVLPLHIGAGQMGALILEAEVPHHFTSEEIRLFTAIAPQIATIMDNHRQFQETKRGQIELDKRAQQLAAVAEVSSVSSKELDIQKMLESVVLLTQRKFRLYHAHVFLYNEKADELKIAACGWQEGDVHEGTHETAAIPMTQEQSLVARAARTRQPVIVNNVRNEPGWLPNPLLPDTGSELAVPLLMGDRVLGVLDVQSDQLNAFTEEDANIQTTLASQVATALQNARSFTQAQKQAERETMLNVINQKIQSATSVEAVLQIAARELGHALGAPMTIAQISMKDKSS